MAMAVNFAFLVPHAMMKGLTKLTFCESSMPCQHGGEMSTASVPSGAVCSEGLLRLLSSSRDFSAAYRCDQ